ncbi:MAG: hypothetical protein ACKO2G_12125 [Verrucomicrobiales bacterium]
MPMFPKDPLTGSSDVKSAPTGETTPRGKGGRPRKFGVPSHPVTITLPESTLRALAEIDPDRATAIVRLAGAAQSDAASPSRLARIVEIGKDRAVVIVASSSTLRNIAILPGTITKTLANFCPLAKITPT